MSSIESILNNAPRNGDDPLLTPEIAARRIGVSPETVRRWIRNDEISYENIGPHRKRIRASVVDALSPKRST